MVRWVIGTIPHGGPIELNDFTMKDRSDDPSHHERTLLPRIYISLPLREYIPQWLKLNAQFPNFASHNTLINLAHNSIKLCLKLWTSSSPVTTLINWQNWFLSQTELIMLYVYFDILHTWNRHQKTYQFLENRYIHIPSLRHMTF